MASAENVAIIIYSCDFEIQIKEVSFVAKFPCEVLVQWKQNYKAEPVRSSKHQVINNQAKINESLFAQAQVIFIEQKSQFFKKQTSLEVKWISMSRPEFQKPIGKVVIDIAQVLNENPFQNLQRHRLVHSPVKGVQILFLIKAIDKKIIPKNVQDIDRYYLNQFYAKYPRRKIEITNTHPDSIENSSLMSFSPRNNNRTMNPFSKQIPQNNNSGIKSHNPAAVKRLKSNNQGVQQPNNKIEVVEQLQQACQINRNKTPHFNNSITQQQQLQSSLIPDRFYLASQRILPNFKRLESPSRILQYEQENSDIESQPNIRISQSTQRADGNSKEQEWKNRQNQLKKQIDNLTSLWNEHQAEKRVSQLQVQLHMKQMQLQNFRSWQQENLHLKYEMSELKQQLQQIRATVEQRQAIAQFKQVQIKALRDDYETLKHEKEDLEQQIISIRMADDTLTKLGLVEQANKQLTQKIAQLQDLSSKQGEQIKGLKQEKRVIEHLYAEKNAQNEQRGKKITQLIQEKDKQIAQIRAAYLQVEKQLLQSKISIKNSADSIGLLEEQKLQLEQEIEGLLKKIRQTDSALYDQKQKAMTAEKQIKIMTKIVEQKSQMLERANKAISQLRLRNEDLEKNAQNFIEQSQLFKAKQQRFFEKQEKMKENLAILEVESKKIFEMMQEKQESQFALKTQIKSLKLQLQETRQRAELLESQCQNYNKHLNILSEANSRLSRQIHIDSIQFVSQQQKVQGSHIQLQKQRQKAKKVADQLDYLKRIFERTIYQTNEKCQEQMTVLYQQIKQIQLSKGQLSQEILQLKQQNRQMAQKQRQNQIQLKKLEKQNQRLEEWQNRTEKQALNSNQSSNQVNTLKQLIQHKQDVIKQLEIKHQTKQKQLIKSKEDQKKKLNGQLQVYRNQIENKNAELESLKKKLTMQQGQIKQKETKINGLEQKVLNLTRKYNQNIISETPKPRSPVIGILSTTLNSKGNDQLANQIGVLRYCLQENQRKLDQVLLQNQILKKEVEDLVNRKVATKPQMPFLEMSQIRKAQIERMNSCQPSLRQRAQHDLYIIYHQLKHLFQQRDKKQEVSSVIQMLQGNLIISEQRLERHTLQNCQVQQKARQANLKLQQFKREIMKSKVAGAEKVKLTQEIRPLQRAIEQLSMISQKMLDRFAQEKDRIQEDP